MARHGTDIRAIFLLDEAISLLIVEPFYNTLGHVGSPFFKSPSDFSGLNISSGNEPSRG